MSVFLSALVSGEAMAVCGTGTLPITSTLLTELQSKTVCKKNTATPPDWEWQEWHSGSSGVANNLFDYKKGPTNAVDKTKAVGTWTVVASNRGGTVTYNYGTPATTYTYNVFKNTTTGTYDFCSTTVGAPASANVLGATLIGPTTSPVSCGP